MTGRRLQLPYCYSSLVTKELNIAHLRLAKCKAFVPHWLQIYASCYQLRYNL